MGQSFEVFDRSTHYVNAEGVLTPLPNVEPDKLIIVGCSPMVDTFYVGTPIDPVKEDADVEVG